MIKIGQKQEKKEKSILYLEDFWDLDLLKNMHSELRVVLRLFYLIFIKKQT